MKHIFTVNVEDWYNSFPPSIFRARTSIHRLEIGLHQLLDLLDERATKGTFFWYGSYARRYPLLMKEVQHRGHEIGCHGYGHFPIFGSSRQWFYDDTVQALAILRDLTGEPIRVYRAPNFSIRSETFWALDMLASLGIEYDSSIFPLWRWGAGLRHYRDDIHVIETSSGKITEVPISKRSIAGFEVPVSGGAYFRAYPYGLTKANICHRESYAKPAVFYINSWELDHEHPRLAGIEFSKLTHYAGLSGTKAKLRDLLRDFSFAPLTVVSSQSKTSLVDQDIRDIAHFAVGRA